MEQVIENVQKNIVDKNIRDILTFLTSVISDTQLQNLLLKSFVEYPHYRYLRQEAENAVRINVRQLPKKLTPQAVAFLILDRVTETTNEIKTEAESAFEIFTGKIKYSIRYRHLLDTDDFIKLENYLRGSYERF